MQFDILQLGAVAGAILSIFGVWGFVVSPFKEAIKTNDETMRSLQDTIKNLSFELKESQRDRQSIHNVLDRHEQRIGKNEDAIIVHTERIATLFKTKEDKK
ncbi:TPA: hypothetical protein U1D13_000774 [Streptococcus suis]|nr:hypothetical protein [Streptococcus suis]HEM3626064.1 hypothetical protein [Streptococcus suis]HEM3630395.1 hypothetical protein [Streptococcus suis]HEM3643870.1 hypothetical protein [Streptococcus suis]HEM3652353.1 hypothetical protein [Streptococcus suis]